ncbi:peptide-methionine (R)-S-oxide reductase MsrB [Sphingosinicella rhizophila]|uniref:peptide-methionine (R)-S-oxide reductase n=1 Tax=Sphingosinicella rhizophila TaxID=3050082 RepID=A0ABU3Q7P3_9SPHN|nr:peptide-methionine (R)-S-oxide reductase MsrB [Sphingosinicella sp. GR2756]MDT9599430.1 peptide-methionine (R)-S-oxide reductase MsrB [Sphingosinicella sp. GR2756]
MFSRRSMIGTAGAGALGGLALLSGWRRSEAAPKQFQVGYSDAEWKRRLRPDQYQVLRRAATERPGSSPLDKEKRPGTFVCAGCALPLFSSKTKFESGTGWPSFWKPLPDAVGTRKDHELLTERTEVHCRRCGGHLGHVFKDGPRPTGLRYCMNGVAMRFIPT